MTRHAVALTHVAFEDLGSLHPVLQEHGYAVQYVDACTAFTAPLDLLSADLLVVLGGPVGTYETGVYPFLLPEIAALRDRLARRLPTLGICLGAQLMTAALGGVVRPGTQGKEIGWAPLVAGRSADACPAFRELLAPDVQVLHWHGDTFDLPAGVQHLASTARYENQAWCAGPNLLALQFHPEALESTLERWYVGHCAELGGARIDIGDLRRQARENAPRLERAARAFFREWLDALA